MATLELSSDPSNYVRSTGGETSGVIHLNPTPLVTGSGEAVVFNKSFAGTLTGYIVIELPAPVNGTNGMPYITVSGYNNKTTENGGGPWNLIVGGNTNTIPDWTNTYAYFIGSNAFSTGVGTPQNVQFLTKTGAFAIALGTATTTWETASLQIRVQAGYNTHDSTLQSAWVVNTNVTALTGWTVAESMVAKRALTSTGDLMTGTLDMSGNRVLNVGSGVVATDAVNKGQLDATALRRGALVAGGGSGIIPAYGTQSFPNLSRLGTRDNVINVVNRSGVTNFTWAVVYDSDYIFTMYITSLYGTDVNFGTFHFYMAPTV